MALHLGTGVIGSLTFGAHFLKLVMKTFLFLLLTATFVLAAEPMRESGLSVHMLPERVAAIGGGHGGFSVTNPVTKERGTIFSEPQKLIAYFEHLSPLVQQNGIWIVTTHPTAYSESENQNLQSLIAICAKKSIPVFTCRGSALPGGWSRAR
jgi:hypothetical protein